MKHISDIELFWEKYDNYNIGDYVLLTADHGEYYVDVAEIINIKKFPIELYIKIPYRINNGNYWFGWINYSEVNRKITPEEYESIKNENFKDYKNKKDSEKFNL